MSRRLTLGELQEVTYGNLTIIKEEDQHTWITKSGKERSKRKFTCLCVCGKTLVVFLEHLRSGYTQSCGCFQKDAASSANTLHGRYKGAGNSHPLHNVWRAMISRCYENDNYKHLTHSERFLSEPHYFYEYIENNLGERPENFSLDRVNTSLGYIEGNLRWANNFTQSQNTKSWKGVSSNYKGVCFYKRNSKWGANIRRYGKLIYLGLYDSELSAAKAYVIKHIELEGEEITEDKIQYYLDYFYSDVQKCEADHDN